MPDTNEPPEADTMQVHVIGRHLSLSPDQNAHVEAEAAKLGKFFDGVNEITVAFEREHDQLKAEIVCMVSGGGTLVAVERGRTVLEAIDLAADNMARQIKKYKAKLHDYRLHGQPEPPAPPQEQEPDEEP